jgi:DNA polymerase-3 subunit beta
MAANIGDFPLIIPMRGLELVEKLDGGDQLTILEGESGFQFETASEVLTVSRSHGTFPDYSRVLPTSHKTEIVIDKAALLAAIKRVKPLGNSEKPVIDFSVSENDKELLLGASSAADGTDGMSFENSASDAIEATVTGPAAQFALDASKLAPFVERAYGSKTGFITIRTRASNQAVDFYANGGLYRWLQMPTVG